MIDPKTLREAPRSVRLSGRYWAVRWIGLVLCSILLTLSLGYYGWRVIRQYSLAKSGKTAEATVVDRLGGKSWAVVVEFATPVGRIHDKVPVDFGTFQKLEIGQKTMVTYDETDPNNWQLGHQTRTAADDFARTWGFAWLALLLMTFIGFDVFRHEANEEAKKLRTWELGELQVRSTKRPNANSYLIELKGIGSFSDGEERSLEVLIPRWSYRDETSVPILCCPGGREAVPLARIKNAELV